VLRSIQKEPAGLEALLEEVRRGGERIGRGADAIHRNLKEAGNVEVRARRIVESIAIALQASLMAQHASREAGDAFCASRLEGDWGRAFGTLPSAAPCEAIVKRAQLAFY
jgi:putative acyl-CoA dehydrogenase